MSFELTLKGKGWMDELKGLGLLNKNALAAKAKLPVSFLVGTAHHSAVATLELAKK